MKATELQIGDWVMMKPFPDCNPMPDQIVGIEYNSWRGSDYCDWVNCKEWDELSLKEIEPIPLTKELLEKNGFIRDMFYGEWQFDLDLFPFSVVQRENNSWYLGREEHGIAHNREIIDISYVHQLQHAMRICGIQWEFNVKEE